MKILRKELLRCSRTSTFFSFYYTVVQENFEISKLLNWEMVSKRYSIVDKIVRSTFCMIRHSGTPQLAALLGFEWALYLFLLNEKICGSRMGAQGAWFRGAKLSFQENGTGPCPMDHRARPPLLTQDWVLISRPRVKLIIVRQGSFFCKKMID